MKPLVAILLAILVVIILFLIDPVIMIVFGGLVLMVAPFMTSGKGDRHYRD